MKISEIKKLVNERFDVGMNDPVNIYKDILIEHPKIERNDKVMSKILNFVKIQNEKKDKKQNKRKEKVMINRVSFVDAGDGEIYEQVRGLQFIDINGDMFDEIVVHEEIYHPNTGEELKEGKEVVLLSEKFEDYGDITTLIEDIKTFINKYYDCDNATLVFSSWYVPLTWVFDRLNTINYLRSLGDHGTGKSRWMDAVGRICYKPIIGSGAGTVASLKRMVKKWGGTVLTDEGDFKDDDEKSALVKFYNLGFEKNRTIYQCDKINPDKIVFFDPYCPKLITTRKPFKDQALESRCLTHIAKMTTRKDIPILLPKKFFEEQMVLRNKLLKFRFDYYHKIDSDKILDIDLGENIEPRLKQAMLSYASLFANFPEILKEFKEFLEEYQKELTETRSMSFDGTIIKVVYEMIKNNDEFITSGKIVEYIKNLSPDFKIRSCTIGGHLKTLGIKTKDRRFGSKRGNAIVFNETLRMVLKKYVPNIEKEILESLEKMENLPCGPLKKFTGDGGDDNNNKNTAVRMDNSPASPSSPQLPFTEFALKELKTLNEHIKPCPFNDLYNEVDHEISKEELIKILNYLKKEGSVFEPKQRMYVVA